MELYDDIGRAYGEVRRPDARLATRILQELDASESVLNVGAGTGAYEPRDRPVVAVEPSMTMIRQRRDDAAPVVRASAENLPFGDDAFDACLAILTIHHWPEQAQALRELRRVAKHRIVLFTWDPFAPGFWLGEYFPEILDIDRRIFPSMDTLRRHLGSITASEVPIPHDCTDGFLGAYWRRPEAYLDAKVRGSISTFTKLANSEQGLERLRAELASGEWQRRHGEETSASVLDLGYRLVVAEK